MSDEHDDGSAPITPSDLRAMLRNLPRCEGPITDGDERLGTCQRLAAVAIYDSKLCFHCAAEAYETRYPKP